VIFVQLGVLTQKTELKRERPPGRRFPRPRENLKRTEEFRMSGDIPRQPAGREARPATPKAGVFPISGFLD